MHLRRIIGSRPRIHMLGMRPSEVVAVYIGGNTRGSRISLLKHIVRDRAKGFAAEVKAKRGLICNGH